MGAFPLPCCRIDRPTVWTGLRTMGRAECSGPASMLDMDIQPAIGRMHDSRQRSILTTFANHFQKSGSMAVTVHGDHHDIIVTHPSTGNWTGGAGRYYLDKTTGRREMGRNEHPMEFCTPVPFPAEKC